MQPDGRVSQLEPLVSQLDVLVSQLEPLVSQPDGRVSRLEPLVSQSSVLVSRLVFKKILLKFGDHKGQVNFFYSTYLLCLPS